MEEPFGYVDRSSASVPKSKQNSDAHHGNDINNRSTPDNNHLHPHDDNHYSGSGSGSHPSSPNFRKKGSSASQSSLEFGRGEKAISSEKDKSDKTMLKHATTTNSTGSNIKQGHLTPGQSDVKRNSSSEATLTGGDSQIKLPQRFVVKYLGFRETSNLWGIRYTRRPVDEMVSDAKTTLTTNPEKALALLKMEVTEEGILVGAMPQNANPNFPNGKFAIESISYGVQDLVYTRVFAMIVVKTDVAQSDVKLSQLAKIGEQNSSKGSGDSSALPFRCHAFVCDSRQTARRLTYSLASAFEVFSKKVASGKISAPKPKKFAIDLRSPEEIEAEMDDSEA